MKHNVRMIHIFLLTTCILFLSACATENTQPDANEEDSMAETDQTENQEEVPVHLPEEPLQKWDEGQDVQDLQHVLNELSYELEPTGTFDEHTTWAITDIQLQVDGTVTGLYDEETKQAIQAALDGTNTITPEEGLALPSDEYLETGRASVVENPYDVLALVNKEHALPGDYAPNDLVFVDVRFPFTEELPKRQLRQIAADALEELFAASDEAGLDLFAQSGYRSYDTQDTIFASNVERDGEEAANNYSARPGESEHQTGLTMDVSTPAVDYRLVIEFGETPEGLWIAEHAHEYGFIIRYLEGKEHITQYQYEPWHLRYVGKKVATDISQQGITYEEYLEQK